MAVAAVIVGAAIATSGGAARPPVASAQPFQLDSVVATGGPVLFGARPGHPVVLSFFAAWCEPCQRELPALENLTTRPGGPQIVGVDVLDQRADALALMGTARVTFPAGYDHDGSVAARWGVDGLPVTVFVASDGRIAHYHRGELTASELVRLAASTR